MFKFVIRLKKLFFFHPFRNVAVFVALVLVVEHDRFYKKECNPVQNSGDRDKCKPDVQFEQQIWTESLKSRRPHTENNFIILIPVSKGEDRDIIRSVETIVKMSSGIPIVVSLTNSKKYLKETLSKFDVQFVTSSSLVIPFASYAQKVYSTFGQVANIFHGLHLSHSDDCPSQSNGNIINIHKLSIMTNEFNVYNYSAKDGALLKDELYGDSKYNIHAQKYLYSKQSAQIQNSEKLMNYYKERCEEVNFIKRSFKNLAWYFPSFKYVVILDVNKHFSTNIIRFFQNTSKLFDLDPSIYCISGHNPLMRNDSLAPPLELFRVDHFIYGGATLLPRKVSDEIASEYNTPLHTEEQILMQYQRLDPIDDVVNWLSWWRRRRVRGCVHPSVPRVCDQSAKCTTNSEVNFELENLVRYKYFVKTYNDAQTLRPLNFEDLPCNNNSKPKLDKEKTENGFIIYVKMNSPEDDVTLHHIFKCFGIGHKVELGNFENLYKFYWQEDVVYMIGVPYSKLGSSIIKGSHLYMIDLGFISEKVLMNIYKSRNYNKTIEKLASVPYVIQNDDNDVNTKKIKN